MSEPQSSKQRGLPLSCSRLGRMPQGADWRGECSFLFHAAFVQIQKWDREQKLTQGMGGVACVTPPQVSGTLGLALENSLES